MAHGHRANSYDTTKVGNRPSEQSAEAVLVGIGHSTNSVGLPTTASGDLFYIEPYDD